MEIEKWGEYVARDGYKFVWRITLFSGTAEEYDAEGQSLRSISGRVDDHIVRRRLREFKKKHDIDS